MPGIFGVIDLAPVLEPRHQQELLTIGRRMSAAMMYEPFYSEDIVSCRAVGACVGRVGFSAGVHSDGATVEKSVFAVSTDDVVSEAAPLRSAAGTCPGRSADIERLYERLGESGLTEAFGNCAAFVADPIRGRCFLFNDRYGKERLFLHQSGTRVFFSSEAKAVLAAAPETRAFDPRGLATFLACGCTLGTRSLFAGIDVLEGGTVLTFDGPVVRRRRYVDQTHLERLAPVPDDEFVHGLSDSLRSAVNRFVHGPFRVGISLTGGLDSRMIMAALEAPPHSVPCYTFGSMYRTTGDVAVARQVAASCRHPHQVIELGRDFLNGAAETLERSVYISDGYLGLSGAAELYLNKRARSIAPGRLTGNWGGELMRGVRAFRHATPKGGFITSELAGRIDESAAEFSTVPRHPLSAALFHQMPFQGYGRNAVERSQLSVSSPFVAEDVITWLYRASPSIRQSRRAALTVIGCRPDLLTIPTDLGLLGTEPSFLRPALRRTLVKAEYLTSHGAPNWLAMLSSRLPAPALETRFLGIDKFHHFRFWIRHDLSGFVRDTLIHQDLGDLPRWFDMRRVERMVNDHIDGRANYTDEIDKLLTVAVARRTLFGFGHSAWRPIAEEAACRL